MPYKVKILDFDIENRPLTYWAPDMPTAEITAITSCWYDPEDSLETLLLGPLDGATMLQRFVDRYNEADMVTGHYIRRHDLPHINGALMEFGMPQLGSKLTCDTKMDMHKKAGIPATQEYLLELFGLGHKQHMSQVDWREANRLTAVGIYRTQKRVESDVICHMLMRKYMIEKGLLGPPRIWKP